MRILYFFTHLSFPQMQKHPQSTNSLSNLTFSSLSTINRQRAKYLQKHVTYDSN